MHVYQLNTQGEAFVLFADGLSSEVSPGILWCSLSLSLSLSLCLSLVFRECHSFSLSLSLCVSHSLSLSHSLCPPLSISLYVFSCLAVATCICR